MEEPAGTENSGETQVAQLERLKERMVLNFRVELHIHCTPCTECYDAL